MADRPASLLEPAARRWTLASGALALLPLLLQLPPLLAGVLAVVAVITALASGQRVLPVPVRVLLVLGMLAAVYWQLGARPGRDTGCALLAAMLALKSSELRSLRDARSLLGFALFAPFAAFLLDQGPLTMGLAVLATLAILLTLQRLARAEGGASNAPLRGQLRGVGRLLALGLPLALAAFWLFPRLSEPLWGLPDRAVGKPGLSDRMDPSEWLDLMADDAPALRVTFFGAVPSPEQRYWRGPVMTHFDGRRWERDPYSDRRPPAPVMRGTPQWEYQIDYEPTDRRQLVALDLPLHAAGRRHAGRRLQPAQHAEPLLADPLAPAIGAGGPLHRTAHRVPATGRVAAAAWFQSTHGGAGPAVAPGRRRQRCRHRVARIGVGAFHVRLHPLHRGAGTGQRG